MGILSRIKKAFIKEKEVEVLSLHLFAVPAWIEGRKAQALKSASTDLTIIRQHFLEEKDDARKAVNKLQAAALKNPNIPERVQQIMEGNRSVYAQRVTRLLDNTTLPKDFDELNGFSEDFDKRVQTFAQGTMKSRQVLNEFFRDELNTVSKSLHALEETIKKIRTLISTTNIDRLLDLHRTAEQLVKRAKREFDLEQRLPREQEALQEQETNITRTEEQLQELERSDEYLTYVELMNEKSLIEKKIKELANTQRRTISSLEPALKKYEHLFPDTTIIQDYLHKPMLTLLNDRKLSILPLLRKVRHALEQGTLDIRDKKKEKLLKELKKLTIEHFDELVKKHGALQRSLDNIYERLQQERIVEHVKELKELVAKEKENLEAQEESVRELEEEKSNIIIEQESQKLARELSILVRKEVIIVQKREELAE